jgi:hypothetical protein
MLQAAKPRRALGSRPRHTPCSLLPCAQAFLDDVPVAAAEVGIPRRAEEDSHTPLAVAITAFHVLLLYPKCFRAICTLNNKPVRTPSLLLQTR